MKNHLLRQSTLCLLMTLMCFLSTNATWAYDNTPATFSWTVGNESSATITGTDVAAGVKSAKVKVGFDLSTGTKSDYAANNGNMMVTYQPGTSNPGAVADDMIEYTIVVKKGVTFTLQSISYDALKDGTDNATYKWSYTIDGVESEIVEISKDNIVRNNNTTGSPALNHVEPITGASAGKTVSFRIYVSGFANNKKLAISNVKITGLMNGEVVQRAFTDFKVDFRVKNGDNNYTVILPTTGELPGGVTIDANNYNGNQHGVQNPTITVAVDGPVKFTIGSCQYGSHTVTVTDANGGSVNIDNNYGCENGVSDISTATYTKYVVYTYNNETPTTLTFAVNGYLPFFFAEACDFIESCDVTYYDVDGKTVIGSKTVDGGSELAYAYGASDVTVASGKAFRGWFSSTALTAVKIPEGTAINEDLKLYAKATDIEVAEVGKIFTYDLTKPYFYVEDHELFTVTNAKYYNNHGWKFAANSSFSVQVAGNAQIVLTLCQYGTSGAINITNSNGTEVGTIASSTSTADGGSTSFNYIGEATTLTFSFASSDVYLHGVKVYNVESIPVKDAATGYYIIGANDAAGFLLALNSANAEATADKPAMVFLPNGFYNLGNTCLTGVSSNVSIIGESQDGVTIKNAPDEEGIGVTATLLFSGNNIYLQDLALNCSAENCATPDASRCVTIQDKGSRNVCKNVSLLSGQDTYYSNGGASQRAFFDDCYITGTVDFLCGGGDVVFNNTTLYVNSRSSADVIAAPNTEASTKYGYLMLNCTIDGAADQANKYNFCRPWNNSPAATWINTTCKLAPSAAAYTNMTDNLVLRFHEFGTKDADGNAITGHNLNACKGKEGSYDLYIDEATANTYTIETVLGDWAATAKQEATQLDGAIAEYKDGAVKITPADDGAIAYLIEKNGEFVGITKEFTYPIEIDAEKDKLTIRSANARGGFGPAKQVAGTATSIKAINAAMERGEQVIFNLAGQRVDAAYKGLVIKNGVKMMQK